MEMNHKKLIAKGFLSSILLSLLLTFAITVLLPQYLDVYPPRSEEEQKIGAIILIGVYLISLATGILIVVKGWKRN